MPYAAILVPVDADLSAEPRLHLAAALATRFEARLIGLAAESWRVPFVVDPLTGGYAAAELIALEEGQVQADLGCAKAQFEAAAPAVTAGSEWRQAIQSPLAEVLGLARAADLIVTSHPHDHGLDPMAIGLAALVLQAGRPVLIAPPHARRARRVAQPLSR